MPPQELKASILQLAIQGKLVEQRPEEGTGGELLERILVERGNGEWGTGNGKKLARRREAGAEASKTSASLASPASPVRLGCPVSPVPPTDAPFDIPESWVWVRLGEVTDMLAGFAFKSADFKAKGKYRLLRGINLAVGDVRWKDKDTVYVDTITDRMSEYRLKKGDVLIGLDRPWITDGTRVAVFEDDKETYLVQRVLRLRETGCLIGAYVALLLHSALLRDSIGDKTTGISVPHISPGQVGNLIIPLPPLAEQKRIVAKLEELLPLCERLK